MKRWLRRLRGALGVAVSWGVVWGTVGGVLEAVFGLPRTGREWESSSESSLAASQRSR